jgi:hypothetical protein
MEIQEFFLKSPSIFDMIQSVTYVIHFLDSAKLPAEGAERFWREENFPVFWTRKNKSLDLKDVVDSLAIEEGNVLRIVLRFDREGVLRPEEALDLIFGWAEGQRPPCTLQKVQAQFKESKPCPTKS